MRQPMSETTTESENAMKQNYLVRHIGIWYHSHEWADQTFDEIQLGLDPSTVNRLIRHRDEKYIEFTDGNHLRMIPAIEASRGFKTTETYIQYGTPLPICSAIIYPTSLRQPIVIRKASEILRGGMTFEQYWREMDALFKPDIASLPELRGILYRYFDVGNDCYTYTLTRVKEAFNYGTVGIDDFVEWDDKNIDDLAAFIINEYGKSRPEEFFDEPYLS